MKRFSIFAALLGLLFPTVASANQRFVFVGGNVQTAPFAVGGGCASAALVQQPIYGVVGVQSQVIQTSVMPSFAVGNIGYRAVGGFGGAGFVGGGRGGFAFRGRGR